MKLGLNTEKGTKERKIEGRGKTKTTGTENIISVGVLVQIFKTTWSGNFFEINIQSGSLPYQGQAVTVRITRKPFEIKQVS